VLSWQFPLQILYLGDIMFCALVRPITVSITVRVHTSDHPECDAAISTEYSRHADWQHAGLYKHAYRLMGNYMQAFEAFASVDFERA
jgi:hypothetical protein